MIIMGTKTLHVGVIGLGMGKHHTKAVYDTENAVLSWVCDTDEELLETEAKKMNVANTCTDYRDMLSDPTLDAVIIASPDQLHREMIVNALAAGKHILCEKPLALTREDIEAIVTAVRKSDRIFMVGQICRYTPGFYEAKKRIDAGEIGELTFVESEYAHDYSHILSGKHSWRSDPLRNGVVGGGCHAVDLLRWIAGDPELITAYSVHKTLSDVTPYDDTHIAIMKFPNGVIGKVFTSISCRRDYTMRSVFYGTKGTIITDNTSPTMRVFRLKADGIGCNVEDVDIHVNNHNAFGEFAEFYDSIVNGRAVSTTVEEGANTIVACLAIVESANTCRTVAPEYIK